MKRYALILALGLLLCLLWVTGCSKEVSSEQLEERMQTLLSNHYDVEYLFLQSGFVVDVLDSVVIEQERTAIYFRVNSQQYQSLKDLEDLLKDTYANQDLVQNILKTPDRGLGNLFIEQDKKLYMSSDPDTPIEIFSPQMDTIQIISQEEDLVVITVEGISLSGNQTTFKHEIIKDGKQYLLAGLPTTVESELPQIPTNESFDDAANIFISQLNSGNIDLVSAFGETITQPDFGILSATLVESNPVDNAYQEYLVEMEVTGGDGTFPEGTNRYRLGIKDLFGTVTVDYFRLEEEQPYNYQLSVAYDPAQEQVTNFINLFGAVTFETVAELEALNRIEYCLYELTLANPDKMTFTQEEVAAASLKYFNISDISAAQDSMFYQAASDCYIFLGRGYTTHNSLVYPESNWNDYCNVLVKTYADTACIVVEKEIVYTLQANADGSYEFVSASLV